MVKGRFPGACTTLLYVCLNLGLWIATPPVLAQKGETSPPVVPQTNGTKAEVIPADYLIGPGDVLGVSVLDGPELSGRFRVTDSGFLALPSLPTLVKAEGLTALQLTRTIGKALQAADLIRDPVVNVYVEEYHSRTVTVLGAVAKPSVYPLQKPTTVLEILSTAGGLTPTAGPTLTLTRQEQPADAQGATKGDPSGSAEKSTISIDLIKLMTGKDPSLNLELRPGDALSVSTAPVIYVVGAVNKPGAFVLQDQQVSMTALKAMGLVGGLTGIAAGGRSIIIRKSADGQNKELPIDLTKLMHGKAPDQPLQGDDILFVPDSRAKKSMRVMADAAHTAVYAVILEAGYRVVGY